MTKNKSKSLPKKSTSTEVKFPATLLEPVSEALGTQLKSLKKQKSDISKEDPFMDDSRVTDNAATDTEADEQFGHARVSAIKSQLNRRIIQTRQALSKIKIGTYGVCESCGQMIDTDRLMVYPEATLCVSCERQRETSK